MSQSHTFKMGRTSIIVSTETITPDQAQKILDKSLGFQRPLRKSVYMAYARDMQAGRWLLTGEPLKFDGRGKLIDGQHRLKGCIESGVPLVTFVMRGLSKRTTIVIDSNFVRSFADVLLYQFPDQMGNEARIDSALLRGIISRTLSLIMGTHYNGSVHLTFGMRQRFTKEEKLQFFEEHQDKLLRLCNQLQPSDLVSSHIQLFSRFILSRRNAKKAKAYIDALAIGDNLRRGSTELRIRNKLIYHQNDVRRVSKGINKEVVVAAVLEGWNEIVTKKEQYNIKVHEKKVGRPKKDKAVAA